MLSAPIIIFYSIFILILCVIGLAPTALWQRFGRAAAESAGRARRQRAAAQFARATSGTDFAPDITYVPQGIGFAVDRGRGLLFLGGERGGRPAAALVPLATLRAHARGVLTGGFRDENYIELRPAEPAAPGWRVSCGTDAGSAYAIEGVLSGLGVAKG